MNYHFAPEASAEVDAARDAYERAKPGLGDEFAQEVADAIERVLAFPNAAPLVERGARRIRVHRFPYGIVYRIQGGEIRILAVMHLHRRPGYWIGRI